MKVVMLRKRKLGRGSTNGIKAALKKTAGVVIRNFREKDWAQWSANDDVLLVRWGCTEALNGRKYKHILNTGDAIRWAGDKRKSRLDMQAKGVPVPKTYDPRAILASFGDGHEGDFGEAAAEAGIDKQWVLRPARHAQGRNLLHGTIEEIDDNLDDLYYGARRLYDEFLDGYLSEKIDKVAEYRVFVFRGRVAWVAKKTPGNPDQVAWNVAQGGRFDNVRWGEWPTKVCQAALDAMAASPLDFGGVDVMVDAEGNPYVLEVNSAPSQTSPYRQECVARCIDWFATEGYNEEAPAKVQWSEGKTYKSYIHTAVRGEANNANA